METADREGQLRSKMRSNGTKVLGHAPPSTGPDLEERERGILFAVSQHAAATG